MGDWWKKGLRTALVVFAVAAVGAVASCGGGGDDDEFNFNGTWSMTSLIVQSNVPGFPVGMRGVDVVRVSQSGTTIAVGVEGVALQTGTCDPNAGTFSVSGVDQGVVIATTGQAVDENTMAGEWTMTAGPGFLRATFTAELATRALAAGAMPAAAGFMGGAPQLLK